MGFPIVIGPSSEVIREVVDQTVVSVGPYMFQTAEALFNNSRARSRGMPSPPQRTLRFLLPSHPASRSNLHVAGVACITVGAVLSNISRNWYPSIAPSRLTSTMQAPTISGK